ncbi:MAG: hypothetical protein BGP13_13360 [Sphingobacteriales bacterium 40-81]|nr:MAG: hypothetical protein BGP13_13360 [Sphingobacteriales bacterium 40-81]
MKIELKASFDERKLISPKEDKICQTVVQKLRISIKAADISQVKKRLYDNLSVARSILRITSSAFTRSSV